jgi:mannosyltransferase
MADTGDVSTRRYQRKLELAAIDGPVLALTALAIVLACVHLGTKSLDADESVSAIYSQMPFAKLWHIVTGPDPNMGAYYLLLHFWVKIFGTHEVALRAMSVLLSCFAIGLIVAVGTRLFNRRTGLVAGLLLAVNSAFIAYEQSVRSYGLLVTLTLLSTYLFLRALDRPTSGRVAVYALVSAVAVYVHYFVLLVLLVHLVALLSRRDQREHARRWALAGLFILIACAPAAIFAHGDRSNVSWIRPPSLRNFVGFPAYLTAGNIHGGLVAAVVLGLLIIYWLATEYRGSDRWSTVFTFTWLVLPVVLTFIESHIAQPFWVSPYMIIVLPAFLLLPSAAITKLPGREVSIGVLVVAIALLAIDLGRWYRAPAADNYRLAAHYVIAHQRRGDVALYESAWTVAIVANQRATDTGFEYYAERMHATAPPASSVAALTAAGTTKPQRVWLVIRHTTAFTKRARATIAKRLEPDYVQSGPARDFTVGPTVVLFLRRAG